MSGETNSGKTALLKKLESNVNGVVYIDLRNFFDGSSFVFETVDFLYNKPRAGPLGIFLFHICNQQ